MSRFRNKSSLPRHPHRRHVHVPRSTTLPLTKVSPSIRIAPMGAGIRALSHLYIHAATTLHLLSSRPIATGPRLLPPLHFINFTEMSVKFRQRLGVTWWTSERRCRSTCWFQPTWCSQIIRFWDRDRSRQRCSLSCIRSAWWRCCSDTACPVFPWCLLGGAPMSHPRCSAGFAFVLVNDLDLYLHAIFFSLGNICSLYIVYM